MIMDICSIYLLSSINFLEDPKLIEDMSLSGEDIEPIVLQSDVNKEILLMEEEPEKEKVSDRVGTTWPSIKRKGEEISIQSPKKNLTMEKESEQTQLASEKKENLDKLLASLRSDASSKFKDSDKIDSMMNGHGPSNDTTYLFKRLESMIDEKLKKQREDIEHMLERKQKELILQFSNIVQMMIPSHQQTHIPSATKYNSKNLQNTPKLFTAEKKSPPPQPIVYQLPQLRPVQEEHLKEQSSFAISEISQLTAVKHPVNLDNSSLFTPSDHPTKPEPSSPQVLNTLPEDPFDSVPMVPLPSLKGNNGESIEAPQTLITQNQVDKIVSMFNNEELMIKLNREQYARKMTQLIFSKSELSTSNISGVLGSKKLNEEKIDYLRRIIFNLFPCNDGEEETLVWKNICSLINEVHRNVKKYEKKKLNPPIRIERPSYVFNHISNYPKNQEG